MKTAVHIEVEDVAHTITMPRPLTPEERRRVLQALCGFCRTLQLWLGGPGEAFTPRQLNELDEIEQLKRG